MSKKNKVDLKKAQLNALEMLNKAQGGSADGITPLYDGSLDVRVQTGSTKAVALDKRQFAQSLSESGTYVVDSAIDNKDRVDAGEYEESALRTVINVISYEELSEKLDKGEQVTYEDMIRCEVPLKAVSKSFDKGSIVNLPMESDTWHIEFRRSGPDRGFGIAGFKIVVTDADGMI